jgi:hypothetical protein
MSHIQKFVEWEGAPIDERLVPRWRCSHQDKSRSSEVCDLIRCFEDNEGCRYSKAKWNSIIGLPIEAAGDALNKVHGLTTFTDDEYLFTLAYLHNYCQSMTEFALNHFRRGREAGFDATRTVVAQLDSCLDEVPPRRNF